MLAALVIVLAQVVAWPAAATASTSHRTRTFVFVDRSRTILLPGGARVPRLLRTVVRVPSAPGRHPLVIFAHGFALTPATYGSLLDAWARAGYVVAAPLFPLTNAHAVGGPNESDLNNQPRDVSFVLSRLLALSAHAHGVLAGDIDPRLVAVAGQSDGGVTALAIAYERRFRDSRIRAAIVMSGAWLTGMGRFASNGPPLLATQGTGDTINAPTNTEEFFRLAPRPKFLLWLEGAEHLPPYTNEQPQLRVVERATIGFLDHYLLHEPLRTFERESRAPGISELVADP